MIEWMARGEGASKRPTDARFAAFAAHVRRAEAEHEAELLETIAASGDARLTLAVLERRHRDDWQVSRRVEAFVEHESGETIRAAVERIAAAVAGAERDDHRAGLVAVEVGPTESNSSETERSRYSSRRSTFSGAMQTATHGADGRLNLGSYIPGSIVER